MTAKLKEIAESIRNMIDIYQTREKWGAAKPQNAGRHHTPYRITIHHTATPNNDSISMPARMRQMQDWHMRGNGWADIGYHWCIGQDGVVYEGRPGHVIGAHVGNDNTGNIGIAVIGSFDNAEPPEKMLKMLLRLLRAVCKLYNIKPSNIRGHRDYHKKNTCPGQKLYNKIPEIIKELSQ